jgi:alginate O-acetyltransferase complex protein AlgI
MSFLRLFAHDPASPLLFNSGTFFLCFTLFLIGYAVVFPKRLPRTIFVLLFSYYYYYRCNGVFALALVGTTLLDFAISLRLHREEQVGRRKLLVATSVVLNLGLLGYFKYTNFFLGNVAWLTGGSFSTLDIFLPIGISFYTFQSLSYVVDVYRRDVTPTRSLLDYAFYLSFFPQVVAGPIVRAKDLLPQIERTPPLDRDRLGAGLYLILRGLAKKALIADFVGVYCDLVFAQPQAYHSLEVALAVYGYAVQIYFDFSGYSDIAIGMAKICGFDLPDNFEAPYRARSVTEFWKRWHISLSTWLRDYLYIPLGGNRGGKLSRDKNLVLTMLLGGLWHGASWNFVIWGALHGAALVVHKRFSEIVKPSPSRARSIASWLFTFHFVLFGWIFFRSPDLATAKLVLGQLATFPEGLPYLTTVIAARRDVIFAVALGLLACFVPKRPHDRLAEGFARAPLVVRAATLLLLVQGVVQLELTDIQPFIYFQF